MTPTTTKKESHAQLVRQYIAAKKAGDTATADRIEQQLADAGRRLTSGAKLPRRGE